MRRDLPDELASFRSATHFSILQLWFGNPSLHYEAWIRSRLDVIEIGLHFESDPLTNARLLAAFRARERAIRKTLGDGARIETWDKGWARVWESLPLARLDPQFLARIAARLTAYVTALEGVLREELPADVEWSEPKDGRYAPRRLTAGRRPAEREVKWRVQALAQFRRRPSRPPTWGRASSLTSSTPSSSASRTSS